VEMLHVAIINQSIDQSIDQSSFIAG